MIAALLRRLAAHLPVRVITGVDGTPYLSKYLLWQSGEGRDSWRVHLHRFHRSDVDRELHNHPWRVAVAWILAGGYREERRIDRAVTWIAIGHYKEQLGRAVTWIDRRPGSINILRANTFHRVDLLAGESWSLFVSGPIVQSWGFWDRFTGTTTPWREFLAAKGQTAPTGEYWRAQKEAAS